jgi:para-nitrobenzyl esterase
MATTTTTTSGLLQGTLEDGVAVFRGIPYAQPPVGPLRFAPSQPPEPWSGVRHATAFGPTAMQAANAIGAGTTVAPCDEDCLTLNVWTPAADAGHRPVLVWLHGDAFMTGAGSMPMYDGAGLARRGDVVVITLNYRLGCSATCAEAMSAGRRFPPRAMRACSTSWPRSAGSKPRLPPSGATHRT